MSPSFFFAGGAIRSGGGPVYRSGSGPALASSGAGAMGGTVGGMIGVRARRAAAARSRLVLLGLLHAKKRWIRLPVLRVQWDW